MTYKGEETAANKISRRIPLFMELVATKTGKNKNKVSFNCGAVKVKYRTKGKEHELWLVVTKRKNGGCCWLLTRSPKENIVDVIKEAAFTAYGFRWKIEEYHRHIKGCYNLEDIQVKTFWGLQSMLALLTIAMSIIYSSLSPLHIRLLLQSGIKTLNKEKISELRNFIYYKISTIIKTLLANMNPRAFLPQPEISQHNGQLRLALNIEL